MLNIKQVHLFRNPLTYFSYLTLCLKRRYWQQYVVLFLITSVSSVAAQSVPLTEIDTGSSSLNHDISNFYKCVTDTHKDPPSISVVDQCYSDNVQGEGSSGIGSGSDLSSSSSDNNHIEFHHFSDQPPSFITHGFDFHHFDFSQFEHHHSVVIEGFDH